MEKLHIKGGNKLYGTVKIGCAKNAYLPILAGAILCSGKVKLNNYPSYKDIINMTYILENLGAKKKLIDDCIELDMSDLKNYEIPSNLAMLTRSSIFSLGAILGRFKKARVAYPGGCDIGTRPIDLHLKGLRALNVKVSDKRGYINCDGSNMKGGTIHLDFPSVGATENIMMAGVLTKGVTKIINGAKEPEVVDLQNFLNKAGAKIKGAGTNVITIHGVDALKSVEYTPISDRIITGTYILACMICGGEIILENANLSHLEALTSKLHDNTCKIWQKNDKVIVSSSENVHKAITKIETMPYPGFPTDLQPQTVAMLSICKGTSVVIENLFETRFKYTNELIKMGADIIIKDRSAIIKGVEKLYGADVYATDLRGGAGLILAALRADGDTTIGNIYQIERGYENLEQNLANLGVDIKRISV
ncbi:MAG: UDP-N-acetylglucosamine 1-carboxyvinyltransferase [Clostridia bacterium]|nr:UDP-N-acetylglucosamine 1-carboxyvinyltransferase [Clostridia bacterium]MDD3862569.1 UDP-N-acetylglucosamine 1-carboxyvinyltransferase [Clostridia bacterium]